jgi:hypothetical protein
LICAEFCLQISLLKTRLGLGNISHRAENAAGGAAGNTVGRVAIRDWSNQLWRARHR